MDFQQLDDGSLAILNDFDGVRDLHVGGPKIPTVANPRRYSIRILKMPLAAGTDTGGGILSWQNNTGVTMMIDELMLDITTIATAACSISAGTTAVSATTSSANLIDTLDVHSATGTFDNIGSHGAGGKSNGKVANGAWVTISTASGASAGLVGNAYLFLFPI